MADLADVVRTFDPVRAAADEYATTLAKIDKLVAGGALNQLDGVLYRSAAAHREQARAARESLDAMERGLPKDGADWVADMVAGYDQAQKAKYDAIEEGHERERGNVEELAGWYQTLFSQGTRGIWDLFRGHGLRVLSELLAKWTLGQQGTGGGGILGTLGSLLGLSGKGAITSNASFKYAAATGFRLPGMATGTHYASGGMALLGERDWRT